MTHAEVHTLMRKRSGIEWYAINKDESVKARSTQAIVAPQESFNYSNPRWDVGDPSGEHVRFPLPRLAVFIRRFGSESCGGRDREEWFR